jgi:hypothetical protein
MGTTEPGKTDDNMPKNVFLASAPVNLSAKLDVWKTFNDKYMKYVTMYFTAATLTVVILSFCLKTVIDDKVAFLTRSVVGAVASTFAVSAFGITVAVRPRAHRFAEHIVRIETLLSEEEGLRAYFKPLPRYPMMKLLVDVSIPITLFIALVTLGIVFVLITNPAFLSLVATATVGTP